jgi:anti-sigma regulatory factor (Ser/Thr protein kinase)
MSATVTGQLPQPYGFLVAAEPRAVWAARRQVADQLRAWGLPLDETTQYDIELLFSELITNAAKHTGAPCAVYLRWDGKRIRVEVTDTDPQPPTVGEPDSEDETGRGLLLVQELAAAWGVEPDPAGKRVWFEIGTTAQVTGQERLVTLVHAAVDLGQRHADPCPT